MPNLIQHNHPPVFPREQFGHGLVQAGSVGGVRELLWLGGLRVGGGEAAPDVDRLHLAAGDPLHLEYKVHADLRKNSVEIAQPWLKLDPAIHPRGFDEEVQGQALAADVDVDACQPGILLVDIQNPERFNSPFISI